MPVNFQVLRLQEWSTENTKKEKKNNNKQKKKNLLTWCWENYVYSYLAADTSNSIEIHGKLYLY